MTVFEDLIEELKDENLLESSVIDLKQADAAPSPAGKDNPELAIDFNQDFPAENLIQPSSGLDDEPFETDLPIIEKPSSEREFFRKRAMDEVSSLQMVEHVLSGVEREHMKMSPVSYDDLNAKKALHKFLQVSGDLKSPQHAETEYALRQETEAWSFALFERDQKISVANIRRFCEDSRPVLSSAALISLARFYRNSPFSEEVRGKFDFVMTRLFSRDSEDDSRRLLFPSQEMVGHIKTLYANWSSIALYSGEGDQVEISLTVTRFDEFSVEVENAETFDELLETDFFNKVRVYKQESAEMFYVPEVSAAAIDCNLRIGNKYVELIETERTIHDVQAIEEKYGYTYDQIVSNAVGKTLLLVDLLKARPEDGVFREEELKPVVRAAPKPKTITKTESDSGFEFFGINKWLMVVAFLCIVASVGVYLWAENATGDESLAAVAAPIKIEDPDVNKHLRSLRSSQETLYAMTQPTFEILSQDEQKELLQKVLKLANDRNLQKVNLMNNKGRTIAFASKDKIELVSQ